MLLPDLPQLKQLEAISPTTYEAALKCFARAAWSSFGDRESLPQHPASVLGQSFHAVMAAANRGQLGATQEERRTAARAMFREAARSRFAVCHPYLRAKFRSAEELPFFNLTCEQTALHAANVSRERPGITERRDSARERASQPETEVRLKSANGRIIGRLDQINRPAEALIDYKTGPGDGTTLSDRERRQLRLYAFLAMENGIKVTRGIITRSNGVTAEETIELDKARGEAENALKILEEFNAAIRQGTSFVELAQPSPENCTACPCTPFCGAFWQKASPEWRDIVGMHVQGSVVSAERSVQRGIQMITLTIDITGGTAPRGQGAVQAFPESWLAPDGRAVPSQGDTVRVVDSRLRAETVPLMIYVDRIGTTVWTVE